MTEQTIPPGMYAKGSSEDPVPAPVPVPRERIAGPAPFAFRQLAKK